MAVATRRDGETDPRPGPVRFPTPRPGRAPPNLYRRRRPATESHVRAILPRSVLARFARVQLGVRDVRLQLGKGPLAPQSLVGGRLRGWVSPAHAGSVPHISR